LLGFFSGSTTVSLDSCSLVGQQASGANAFYANTCNDVSIINSTAFNILYLKVLGQVSSTDCFAEVPINVQGQFTPVLNGFSGSPTVSGYFTQNKRAVTFSISVNYGSATTITNPTAYITGLPVPPAIDSAVSSMDALTLAPYANSIVLSNGRLYSGGATLASVYTVSGTYYAASA
jgi:hypothetical protein